MSKKVNIMENFDVQSIELGIRVVDIDRAVKGYISEDAPWRIENPDLMDKNNTFVDNQDNEYHLYYIRHSDLGMELPISIENYVRVNFFGTFFTTEDLNLNDKDSYIKITDWSYAG